MDRLIARRCDMNGGHKLQLLRDGDGDIHVCVMPQDHRHTFESVEFCNSGSQSHRTYRALLLLEEAMRLDEQDWPQNLSGD